MSTLNNLDKILPLPSNNELAILSRVLHNALSDEARAFYDVPLDQTALLGFARVILCGLDFLEVYPVMLRVEALLKEAEAPSAIVMAIRVVEEMYATTLAFELVPYQVGHLDQIH